MAQKKYVSLTRLSNFLDNLKTKFSELGHKHTISDITDFAVDSSLSSTSTNPVQNKVLDAEFDAISQGMGALEQAIDDKLNISDYVVDTELTSFSNNPVANKAVNDGINLVYETMFSITDEKADIEHTHTKEDIGLENVDNTADSEKSVYHAEIAEIANSVEWRKIANKPFSTIENGAVLLPLTNVEESDDDSGIGRGSTGRFSEAVVSGEEYKVVFDGAEYYCVAYTDPIMNDYIILGNFTVVEPITGDTNHADTGEPFLICYSIIYKYAGVYTPVTDSHTVSVIRVDEVIDSINESCIPDTIARVEDIPSIDGLVTELFVTEAVSENLAEAKAYTDTVASGKSDSNHNHDSDYADIDHNHDDVYAVANHNHDDKYDGKGAASSAVSTHNTSTTAHNDIRILITELTTKLNNFLDVDDTTTDQLSELIALIQDNATDIEAITSGKVNVSDIINNLTTNVANKPLSAAQGVAIKSLIDDLQTAVDEKADLIHIHPYGVCSSSATYTTKTVTVENFSLVEGVRVIVKFVNANEASSPKLNVNNTGAKPIVQYGTTAIGSNKETNGWEAGAIIAFTYDGTSWVRDYWYNTTYTNAKLGQGFGTCYTATSTAEKEVSMTGYEDKTGGIVSIKFTYSVDADATLNINGQGALDIYYNGSAIVDDVIKGGDVATFINSGSSYRLISVDRWHEDIVALQASESKVKQMETVANGNFSLLLAPSDISGTDYRYTYYADGIYANPSLKRIYADINGTATGVRGVTSGNFLVGNGSNKMTEKTPAEVLNLINGASVASMTSAEYDALETKSANTLYMLTDAEEDAQVEVEYGVTTYDEISDAIDAGKICFCRKPDGSPSQIAILFVDGRKDSNALGHTFSFYDAKRRCITNWYVTSSNFWNGVAHPVISKINGQFETGAGTTNATGNIEIPTVYYEAQTLTEEQQAQARTNIGAFSKESETELILNSSTAGSKKRFKITIDDTGTLTITEDVNIDNLVHTDVTNLTIDTWRTNSTSGNYYTCTYGTDLAIIDGALAVEEELTASSAVSLDTLKNTLYGNYLVLSSGIYYIPTDAVFTTSSSTSMYITTHTLKVDYAQKLTLST